MRVMLLGAGVIGTSSAYYLAKSGHEGQHRKHSHADHKVESYRVQV